jgi:hypothetical protein
MYLNFKTSSAALTSVSEAVVDLTLTSGADLVVAAFYLQASLFELKNDVVTHVSMLIGRSNRKVATLVRSFVGKVSA